MWAYIAVALVSFSFGTCTGMVITGLLMANEDVD